MGTDTKTFKSITNPQNNYLLDRSVQRSETYSGIDGIKAQDRALQETMGRIVDRPQKHLGLIDDAIIQARWLLRDALRTVATGECPHRTGTSYCRMRVREAVISREADWRKDFTLAMAPEAIRVTV